MEDYIDKRDQRDKMTNSIVKRRNVLYQPKEQNNSTNDEDQNRAEELLQKMKDEKEQKFRAQIEAFRPEENAEDLVRKMKEEAERKHRASIEAYLTES